MTQNIWRAEGEILSQLSQSKGTSPSLEYSAINANVIGDESDMCLTQGNRIKVSWMCQNNFNILHMKKYYNILLPARDDLSLHF